MTTRKAGRPLVSVLNRDLIADAALDLVTEQGPEKLTMKVLSERLGVAVSALYNHIANKAELLLLVQDAVMSRVDTSALIALTDGTPEGDPASALPGALREWAVSYREVFAGYPSLIPLIATMPVSGAPSTRRMYDDLAAGLVAAGVTESDVVPIIIAFESFVYGSAMDANAPAGIFTSRPEELDAPTFRSAVAAFTARVGTDGASQQAANPYAEEPFRWGLETLIARTVDLVARPTGAPDHEA
ncbi:Transcriptional regulator, TetR family OS=Tsukamurella paurometabola (strain ATCC 8368 / DSM/ CCUG 35730 / CIP 100753 / JCM 10117 / KCTC 9821 / NBRC 16120/ NCIMB 702349 / NCTC 13040) OX=521096 GN=Tpau_0683 PE=4 SV=1 [Tsukamurella paurometabola]|uniref:Transcriptional regulator, TetR family n=1 Tax=Tsukamurella paurometabola (strain ATCC 8368 / DSM 20162 / CCUG 35730 / CIP 100753 / JCM 10117 / KCTC 9821 / NBRC 16120 / NCIMB 702349 / NCTC 13040) TaxID=521096 RepID=D5UT33_TSUPD|nr:TetR/AcrR family transcriptional regulator [Tsukamurella paurometabola]ADG77320.1 transcriptional regulator, TetR family [Tsukamurella paurometabola DSM 20162]SUP43482.1 Tetracycline repressor protein class D [Tsukamurella paurometabola]